MLARTVYSALVDYDRESFKIEPSLARLWGRSEDGRTWTFQLRTGVRWSDGTPLTARDVTFSFWAAMDPKLRSSDAEVLRDATGALPEVTANEAGEVVFTLKGDHGLFLQAVSSVHVLPAARWEATWKAGRLGGALGPDTPEDQIVSTGPFLVKSYVPGERLVLERNPYSYLADVKGGALPYLDRIVWRIAKDYDDAIRLFEAGEVDVYDQVRATDFDRLKAGEAAGGYTVVDLGPSHRTTFLAFNLTPGKAPAWAAKKDFRRAVAHAIDREGLVAQVLRGKGRPQTTMVTQANRAWMHAPAAIPSFDPSQARRLLRAAGLRDRNGDGVLQTEAGAKIAFEISTNAEDSVRVQAAARVAEDLRRVGIGAEVRPVTFKTLVSRLTDTGDWQAIVLGFGGNVPPDPALWKNVYGSSGGLHVWNPRQKTAATPWEGRIDELVRALTATPDFILRKQAHDEILDLLAEQQPMVFLYSPDLYVAARTAVANFRPSPLRPHGIWNVEELFLDPPAQAAAK
jgi:peptide/nickel transport system substrate-binding protein